MSWKNGTARYPINIDTPLYGNSYVPITIPKYSTKPGPARVVIDLLIRPIRMIMKIIIVLVIAKSEYILLPKSNILRRRIVNATPFKSPI